MKDISDKQVCLAIKKYKDNLTDDKYPYDYLMEWTGAPFKVCYRAMERAYDREYTLFGVSLRTAWLTENGNKLIEDLPDEQGKGITD
jgi:hypothetical protein